MALAGNAGDNLTPNSLCTSPDARESYSNPDAYGSYSNPGPAGDDHSPAYVFADYPAVTHLL